MTGSPHVDALVNREAASFQEGFAIYETCCMAVLRISEDTHTGGLGHNTWRAHTHTHTHTFSNPTLTLSKTPPAPPSSFSQCARVGVIREVTVVGCFGLRGL